MLKLGLQTHVGWSLCILALHGLGCSLERWQRDPGMDDAGGVACLRLRCLPEKHLLARAHGMSAPAGAGWAAHSRPAHGARIRSVGRNLHQRISHLAAGLDPSQVRLNLVAGAGFVCSRETMVWKPFFLPSQVSRCLDMPGLGCVRVCWRAVPGERLRDLHGALTRWRWTQRSPWGTGSARELWLAAELPLASSHPAGSWEKCVWVFARWSLSVWLSVPAAALCIACFHWGGLKW